MLLLFNQNGGTVPVVALPYDAATLRKFLDVVQNSIVPVIYNDGQVQHLVNVIKVDEFSRPDSATGKDETVAAIQMVDAQAETLEGGATGARAQEIHLINCLNSVTPIIYEHEKWGRLRVFVTQMQKRMKAENPDSSQREYSYALTFVDAWGGVWVYQADALVISAQTTITVQTHTAPKWGAFMWGLAQWGA